ncbi:MAG: MmcQ/YjbR family DNA-binding protein [Ignavibacteria bacterium]|nr:MmcQ/YjbR family DNA-binding protein [Ignavibacteria bacterium]MBT8391632.1 MmcQ/YjbR family DNA-binding protein [Ignavibacteria bacterium]NNL19696.1 MmcQ/YjbR family DNA-binding protein [Ignavibacteriaceae bacterium]
MNIEQIREYCLGKKGVTEEFPFDEETLVFKVMGKIFLLTSLEKVPLQINLKCDPGKAIELREKFESVLPGYHMNKKHWNMVVIDGSISPKELSEWIEHSYNLVVSGLKKSEIEQLKNLQ